MKQFDDFLEHGERIQEFHRYFLGRPLRQLPILKLQEWIPFFKSNIDMLPFLGQRSCAIDIQGPPNDVYSEWLAPKNIKVDYVLTSRGSRINIGHIDLGFRYTIIHSHGNADSLLLNSHWLQDHYCPGLQVNAISYDYSGYGTSDGIPSEANTKADIEAVYEYARSTCGIDPEHIILSGFSLGCAASIHLAAALSPTAPVDLAFQRFAGEGSRLRGMILNAPFLSVFRVALPAIAPVGLPLPGDLFHNANTIRYVCVPVWVVHGRRDDIVPFYHGEQLAGLCACPVPPLWLDDASHNDLVEKGGALYFAAAVHFVSELAGDEHVRRGRETPVAPVGLTNEYIDVRKALSVGGDVCGQSSSLELSIQCLDDETSYFAQLEAPPGANISISLFFSLQDTATDFQVGQVAGAIKQFVEFSTALLPKDAIPFLGLRGKIVRDEVGARRYRFVLFFGENWQLGTVRPFSLVRASLQLGKSMPDDDEKASAPVSTLPSLNELSFQASFEVAQLDTSIHSVALSAEGPVSTAAGPGLANLFSESSQPPQTLRSLCQAVAASIFAQQNGIVEHSDIAYGFLFTSALRGSELTPVEVAGLAANYADFSVAVQRGMSNLTNTLQMHLAELLEFIPNPRMRATAIVIYEKLRQGITKNLKGFSGMHMQIEKLAVRVNVSSSFANLPALPSLK